MEHSQPSGASLLVAGCLALAGLPCCFGGRRKIHAHKEALELHFSGAHLMPVWLYVGAPDFWKLPFRDKTRVPGVHGHLAQNSQHLFI